MSLIEDVSFTLLGVSSCGSVMLNSYRNFPKNNRESEVKLFYNIFHLIKKHVKFNLMFLVRILSQIRWNSIYPISPQRVKTDIHRNNFYTTQIFSFKY